MLRKRELVEEEVLIKKAKPIMEKYKIKYGSFVSADDQMGGSKSPRTEPEKSGKIMLNPQFSVKLDEVQTVAEREKLSFHQSQSLGRKYSFPENTAARYGNTPVLLKYLQQYHGKGKKINKLNKQELSALHYAVRYGHMDVIQLLVDSKANINIQGADGAQPIHFAARYFKAQKHIATTDHPVKEVLPLIDAEENFVNTAADLTTNITEPIRKSSLGNSIASDVITYLLKCGANINAVDNYNQTPLNYAAVKGNIEAMAILLKWPGIDVEISDTSGGTALHNTCGNGHAGAAKLLLMAGAQLMVWDNEHMNPLHYAATGEGALILKEIIEDIEKQGGVMGEWTIKDILNDQDNQGQSLLHLAVDVGRYKTCRLLIDKEANVNLCRSGFVTPLHLAAATGNLDIVKLLVESGAEVDAENVTSETPLHRAAVFNRADVVDFLLERGSNIDAVDQDNSTPIVIAASNGNKQTVETLLKRGADLCITDSSEKSSLYWAAEENSVEVLRLLLDHTKTNSCDINLIEQCDRFENTPLHIAAKKGFKHIVKLLLEYGAYECPCNDEELTPLHLAAINGNKKVVTALLLAKPAIINDEDESGNSALHLAALNGHPKIIDILIDYGASVDPRNSVLWTPLDCAAAKGNVESVLKLLERDSPIDPIDLAYTTPLHLASREGHEAVVKALLEQGADPLLLDHAGKNALDMAIENTHKNVVMVMVEHKEWLSMFKNRSRMGRTVTTPFRELIIKMPDVAYLVLNKCMKRSTYLPNDSEEYKVQFFYDLVDDTYSNWSHDDIDEESKSVNTTASKVTVTSEQEDVNKLTPEIIKLMEKKETHPLSIMCEYKRGSLLNHPLIMSLIYEKWGRFGRLVFYSKFVLYFVFLIFLTGYVLAAVPLFPHRSHDFNNTCESRASADDKNKAHVIIFIRAGRWVVIILGGLQLIFELVQLLTRRFGYIVDITNWMEWSIYVLALIFVWHDIHDFIDADMGCSNLNISIGCCAIFLAWIDLLLFLQKFPSLGIYVVMFTDVFKTFLRFSITFILFLVAFGLGFYTLLYDGNTVLTHSNIGRSLVKTLVMMIGEFDFDDLFNGDRHPPVVTWILFFIFVIIMTILLMNLMVGLAVDDIKGVLDQAVLTRVAMQVNLVLDVEKILPRRFRQQYIMYNKTVYPNREFAWYSLTSHVTKMNEIQEALYPEKSVSDVVQEHTQSIRTSVVKLNKEFKEMNKQMKNIEEMLEMLLKNANLINDTDDYNY